MITVRVTRKKKFASALMPYWVFVGLSKADFCAHYGLVGDSCSMSAAGFPIPRLDAAALDSAGGIRIGNGATIDLNIPEPDFAAGSTLFVSTADGILSNEIVLRDYLPGRSCVSITTRGGFKVLPHPVIE